MTENQIAKKFASFLQFHRFSIDGGKFKNVVLGLVFISQADPDTFEAIVEEVFSGREPKHETLADLCQFEISSSHYPWVNNFCDWEGCFHGYSKSEVNRHLALLIDEIDLHICKSENRLDISLIYEGLIDAYGLMGGKAWGEFYTPSSVVRLIRKLCEVERPNLNEPVVYDPACGSGNLFLAFNDCGPLIYGQEINPSTIYLCRMNMILHDLEGQIGNIIRGDTLDFDMHKNVKCDIAVTNPPFNIRGKHAVGCHDIEDFFECGGLPPETKGDFAFIQRCIRKLKDDGLGYAIVYPQVLTRGGAEAKIRKWLYQNRMVKCVIDLPGGLFFNTTIATSIFIFSKEPTDHVLFLDCLLMGEKVMRVKRLSEENIATICDTYQRFLEDPDNLETVFGYSSVLKLNHPNVTNRLVECDFSLSPSDHVICTKESQFKRLSEKRLKRSEFTVKPLDYDRSAYNKVIQILDEPTE